MSNTGPTYWNFKSLHTTYWSGNECSPDATSDTSSQPYKYDQKHQATIKTT